MAQEAGGSSKGRRPAVGPDRERSADGNKVGDNPLEKNVPDRDADAFGGAGPNNCDPSKAQQQGQSDLKRADDQKGQQPGRKRRRSRSRRKNKSASAGQTISPEIRNGSDRNSAAGNIAKGGRVPQPNGLSDPNKHSPVSNAKSDIDTERPQRPPKGKKRRRSRPAAKQERTSPDVVEQGNAEAAQGANRHRQKQSNGSNGAAEGRSQQERSQPNGSSQQDRSAQQGRFARSPNRQTGRHGANGSRRPADGPDRPVYAALDLGTNNCRLLVAEPHGQSFRVVDAFSRIVRLGEGLSQTGKLSVEAQDRAISALKVCQSKLAHRQVKRFRLIATEACRRAKNGSAFLHRVHRETGLKLEIVNRETEARLAVAGCASLVHPEADGVVLFDIGGGSSEIVWLDLDPVHDETTPLPGEKRNRQTRRALRHMSERIRCWTSLQVGVVTLSEKHGGHIVGRDQFEEMVKEVRQMLHHFEEREALAQAIESKHIHMLGTSGTVTTLAGVHLGLERYDRRQVDGTWLNAGELRAMISRILDMDFEERTNNPCIGQDRADLVLAGCAILEAFHREWPCGRLRVADRGLREGILMEMMIDDGVWNPHHAKKPASRKRRPRRRGGRGHRGTPGGKTPEGGPPQDQST